MFNTIINPNASNVQTGRFVNELSAHKEWASRPADERYQSVQSLHEAATRRDQAGASKIIPAQTLEVAPKGGDIALVGKGGVLVQTTNWSFGQIAAQAKAPAGFLRELSAPTAALVLNERLKDAPRAEHQIYIGRVADGGSTGFALRSLNSPSYARVKHSDITGRLLAIMTAHPEWKLPMGYKNGEWGAELVPSGAYLGDRDMFVMLIDGNRSLESPTNQGGLFRGVIIRNSDVGAAALTLDLFLFERVCGNNIIWGFKHMAGFRCIHRGDERQIERGFVRQLHEATNLLGASASGQQELIKKAATIEIGKDKEEVIKKVTPFLPSRAVAVASYETAEKFNQNPRSPWGFVHGLTRESQVGAKNADQRFELDKSAADIFDAFVK
jgi:hypothetical protein